MKTLFPSREQHFSLRWIRGIRAIRQRGLCITSERHIGELGVRCLSTPNRGQDSRQQSQVARRTELRARRRGRLMRSADFASCESEPPRGGCSLSFVLICRCDMGEGWCLSCQYHTPKWRGRRVRVRIIKYFIKLSSNALSGVLPRG